MTVQDKTKVGKKGEILPKKPLREESGIKPGDDILILAHKNELIVKKIYDVKDLLNLPIITKNTVEEAMEDIREESKLQEELTD